MSEQPKEFCIDEECMLAYQPEWYGPHMTRVVAKSDYDELLKRYNKQLEWTGLVQRELDGRTDFARRMMKERDDLRNQKQLIPGGKD